MLPITTSRGKIFLSEDSSRELIDSALTAVMSPKRHSFRTSMLCNEYDDEGWSDCQKALAGELMATPEELAIAQKILDNRLPIEKAQALLQ